MYAMQRKEEMESFEQRKKENDDVLMEKHGSVPLEKHNGTPMEKHDSVQVEKHNSMPMEKHDGVPMEKHNSVQIKKHDSVPMEKHAGVSIEKHGGEQMEILAKKREGATNPCPAGSFRCALVLNSHVPYSTAHHFSCITRVECTATPLGQILTRAFLYKMKTKSYC